MFIEADDGVKLHVDVEGNDSALATIILCHGFLSDADIWKPQREALRLLARVVTWDLRGHGKSGRGTKAHATLAQLGRDVRAVMDATALKNKPVILAGHSMGGIALLHLEEALARVSGVVLLSTSAGGLSSVTGGLPVLPAKMAHLAMPYLLQGLFGSGPWIEVIRRNAVLPILSIVHHFLFAKRVGLTPRQFLADVSSLRPTALTMEFWHTLHQCNAYESLQSFKHLKTTVAVGEDDKVTPPSHSERIVKGIPGARFELVRGAGHMLLTEQPAIVTELIMSTLKDCVKEFYGSVRILG